MRPQEGNACCLTDKILSFSSVIENTMKKILLFLSIVLLLFSCKETVEAPKNLIEQDKMVNILYDLALLDGIKSNNALSHATYNSEKFIYKKYKIDSLQFAKSSQYYASDIDNYKKMYEEVSKRLELKKAQIDSSKVKRKRPSQIKAENEGIIK